MKRALGIIACCLAPTFTAQAAYINENEPNNSIAYSQNVDGYFTPDADSLITNSTLWPHVSIWGNGNDDNDQTSDYFRFTTPGGVVLFDIDYGMFDLDSWLNLYDSGGNWIGSHDDGGGGDPGTSHSYDGYWQLTLLPGTYFIEVKRFADAPLMSGQDYLLHISVENHAVPAPATLALMGAGLAGLGWLRRRQRS